VSGKTLNEYLQNRDFHYPDEAVHCMFSANRWEMKDEIVRELKAGKTIICDRYAYSGVAYSAAKVICLIFNLKGTRF
jgi:dTMP kinase